MFNNIRNHKNRNNVVFNKIKYIKIDPTSNNKLYFYT